MSFLKGFDKTAFKADMQSKNKKTRESSLALAGLLAATAHKTELPKTASPLGFVARGMGKAKGFLKNDAAQTVRNMNQRAKNVKMNFHAGEESVRKNLVSGAAKKAPGENLAAAKAKHMLPAPGTDQAKVRSGLSEESRKNVGERAKSLNDYKNKKSKGPSFAARHPIVTGVGAAVAAKHLMSDKEQTGTGSPQAGNPVSPY